MRVRLDSGSVPRTAVDVVTCFAYEGDRSPRGIDDPGLRRDLARQMKAEDFQGRKGDWLVWNHNGTRGPRYLVVGLGKDNGAPGDAIRTGCAQAAKRVAEFSARAVAVKLPDGKAKAGAVELRAAVEGAKLGAYRFDRHLTDPARRRTRIKTLDLRADRGAGSQKAVKLGEITADAVCLARDLVNEGPSSLTPKAMARRAVTEARKAGLSAKILGPAELKKIGMTALLSVARGSIEPPQVVHLVYRPKRKSGSKPVVLVGKGVTFDSGGLNLKPGPSMQAMKGDMAGAAAVLGAMTALGRTGCRKEVHGLLGLTENMTGGGAYKPGDILQTLSGKTVEIGNTDAEGRLVMCDLLAYAVKRLEPARIVDVATLTGACVIALGQQAAGLFSRHDDLRDELLAAAALAGEKLWPLPMYEEYLQLIQKGPADLCNSGPRWGGAITAALFLGEFLPRDLPWAHLDIAGPAFAESETPESGEGGTGAGVRTLIRWFESF